jgi:hypothetical protein
MDRLPLIVELQVRGPCRTRHGYSKGHTRGTSTVASFVTPVIRRFHILVIRVRTVVFAHVIKAGEGRQRILAFNVAKENTKTQ